MWTQKFLQIVDTKAKMITELIGKEPSQISLGSESFSILYTEFPLWKCPLYEIETRISFAKDGEPYFFGIDAITGFDDQDADDLAKAVSLSEWIVESFMEHGATEDLYDSFFLALKGIKLNIEHFIIDLKESRGTRFKYRIFGALEIRDEDHLKETLRVLQEFKGYRT